ncbi:putative disease resistance protein RGA4 [Bienertia sinuspersici]
MADFGISIAEKLLEAIGSELIKQVCDMWGYRSQLDDLKETVTTIQKVLLDADSRHDLSNEERDYIDKLKDAVYDADDLFDEFLTLAELKQLRPLNKRGKIYEKVRRFFSSKNQLGQAYRMSRDVKAINKRLVDITKTHKDFGFSVDYKPIIKRREETCSYIDANKIVGREKDKEAIIDMLLDRNNEEICFTTIVGVGGLGKTALAQLVYEDERINEEFPNKDLKFWVCVSDQEGEQFDVKTILMKILEQVTKNKVDDSSTFQLVQRQFQEKLRGQKYLLVLDDVWNEDPMKWRNLQEFLILGQAGSRVMVTTRSMMTAIIIDERHAYELEGLSGEDSWRLFEMSAFDNGIKRENHIEFVEIGKKIVDNCHNNPLALKVVGSLLFGQSISKWHLVKNSELGKIEKGDKKIMSTLKLSYHNLPPSLKSCFSYCAIFPKDYRIPKQMLFGLWMAHGYITSSLDGNESLEEVAEEYFAILLRRCFFQDVVKTKYDGVKSVKIHDLMHNVAQEVGREEIHAMTCIPNILGDKVRHVGYVGDSYLKSALGSNKIRSFIFQGNGKPVVDVHTQIENWMFLRVLVVSNLDVVELPNSIEKLTSLQVLPYFLVDLAGNTTSQEVEFEAVKCIKGEIEIIIDEGSRKIEGKNGKKGVYLKSVKHVTEVNIKFEGRCDSPEGVLEALEPSSNVKKLVIFGYKGEKIPKWGRAMDNWAFSLSLLVEIELVNCQNLEEIPVLSKLPHLKTLYLRCLDKLEYMEENTSGKSDNQSAELFFPSLVNLNIVELERLKGWWKKDSTSSPSLKGVDDDNCCCLDGRFRFPCLSSLRIINCPNLTSFPSCPTTIEELALSKINKRLQVHVDIEDETDGNSKGDFRLWTLEIDIMRNLKSPPLIYLKYLTIWKDEEVEDKHSESGEVESHQLQKWSSSLKVLEIPRMNTLRRLFGETGLQHFTALEFLRLGSFVEDKADTEDEFEACSFPQDLRRLYFNNLHKMTSLPKGMQCLTSLKELYLWDCKNLKALPEWITCLSSLEFLDISKCPVMKSLPEVMPQLTSLQRLYIKRCPELQERCKEPDGEDRPKIQHIPHVVKKLTSLQVLPYFLVDLAGNTTSQEVEFEAVKCIEGRIEIIIDEDSRKIEGKNGKKGVYLKSVKHVTKVDIKFRGRCDSPAGVLEALEPPSNVKKLVISGYKGEKIPKWGRAMDNWAFSLSLLVEIELENCQNLEEIPVLSKLPHLKTLYLRCLDKLEYMEENTSGKSDNQSAELFFPSLVSLFIFELKRLKGWWKKDSTSFSSLNGVDDDNRYEEVEDKLSKSGEVESHQLQKWAFSLKELHIPRMNTLRRLFGETGLQHFTALKGLTLGSFEEDKADTEDEFEACSFP